MAELPDDRAELSDGPADRPDDPADRLRDLLEEVVEVLDLDAEVEVVKEDEVLRGSIEGEDLGVLIGRHGHTIDALEHLATRIALRGIDGERLRVVVDAAGYRARRAEALERQADKAASEAVRFGRPVALDALGASERRLVHEYLRDRHDVETYSEGDEPDRHLVVAPVAL
jgi:spoIIIJ-associated protein